MSNTIINLTFLPVYAILYIFMLNKQKYKTLILTNLAKNAILIIMGVEYELRTTFKNF